MDNSSLLQLARDYRVMPFLFLCTFRIKCWPYTLMKYYWCKVNMEWNCDAFVSHKLGRMAVWFPALWPSIDYLYAIKYIIKMATGDSKGYQSLLSFFPCRLLDLLLICHYTRYHVWSFPVSTDTFPYICFTPCLLHKTCCEEDR